jgi:hypothetical protein
MKIEVLRIDRADEVEQMLRSRRRLETAGALGSGIDALRTGRNTRVSERIGHDALAAYGHADLFSL